MFWKKPKIEDLLPPPVKVSHGMYSMALSSHDEPGKPTDSLLSLSFSAIQKAHSVNFDNLSSRIDPPYYPNIWPGEHYKLLAGLVMALNPTIVIEIGTATGLSSLALKKHLPKEGKIYTFDLVPWEKYERAILTSKDFEDERLVQFTDDLIQPENISKHQKILEDADLIFIDATHDGKLEEKLMENFTHLNFKKSLYIVLDDIRFWTMLKMWREIKHPKLDLTSFGHWSGTGIIEWTNFR